MYGVVSGCRMEEGKEVIEDSWYVVHPERWHLDPPKLCLNPEGIWGG